MQRSREAEDRRLLTPADSIRIRSLSIERDRICKRLRDLDAREIAAFIPQQFSGLYGYPIAQR